MWRFFYCQALAQKEVLEGLGSDRDLLLSQFPTQCLMTQGWVFDLFHEDRDRFGGRRLPADCL